MTEWTETSAWVWVGLTYRLVNWMEHKRIEKRQACYWHLPALLWTGLFLSALEADYGLKPLQTVS